MNTFEALCLVREAFPRLEVSALVLALVIMGYLMMGIFPLLPYDEGSIGFLRAASGQRIRPLGLQLLPPTVMIVALCFVFIVSYNIAVTQSISDYRELGLHDRMTVVHNDERYREAYLNSLFVSRPRPYTREFYHVLRESRRHPNIPWHFILNPGKIDLHATSRDEVVLQPEDAIGQSRGDVITYGKPDLSTPPEPNCLDRRLAKWRRFIMRIPLLKIPKQFWPEEVLTDLDYATKGD